MLSRECYGMYLPVQARPHAVYCTSKILWEKNFAKPSYLYIAETFNFANTDSKDHYIIYVTINIVDESQDKILANESVFSKRNFPIL